MDFDTSFMDTEDFGLAKSFTTAPIALMMPSINPVAKEAPDAEKQIEQDANSFVSDGFCFKMAPGQDVSQIFLVNPAQCLVRPLCCQDEAKHQQNS
jgi:hypothetical protein